MNEQDLDKLLEEPQDSIPVEEEKFQKRIRRAMSHSLYSRIIASILLFVLLTGGIIWGTSRTMDLIFYNPLRESAFLVPHDRKGLDFAVMLEDTISTYFPGKYCMAVDNFERNGFGRYEGNLNITDSFSPQYIPGPANTHVTITHSKLNLGQAPLYVYATEFSDPALPAPENPEEIHYFTPLSTVRQELQELPRSAQLDVSVSLDSTLTSDETASLINKYPEMHFRWLALEGQNTSMYQFGAGGMFLDHIEKEELTEEALRKYPNYYLPTEITGADLEQCLISRLQLLVDHPRFVSLMESQLEGLISMPRLQQRLTNARGNWACYGFRLTGSPDEIELLMEELPVTAVTINDVKVSSFQK